MRTVDIGDWGGVVPADVVHVVISAGVVTLYELGDTLPARPTLSAVPEVVTMRQARLALLGAGVLAGVESAIDGLPEPQRSAARIEWEYSGEVQRYHGLVAAMAPALGMTEAQIDALFLAAAAIP